MALERCIPPACDATRRTVIEEARVSACHSVASPSSHLDDPSQQQLAKAISHTDRIDIGEISYATGVIEISAHPAGRAGRDSLIS